VTEIQTSTWSETAASNNSATPNGWPEGMSYSAVNDCAREMMTALKRDWNRAHATVASGGTAAALTLTYTTAPPAYVQGMQFSFRVTTTNTAAPTLNVNGLGAKSIMGTNVSGLVALSAGDLVANTVALVQYDSVADAMLLLTPVAGSVNSNSGFTLGWTTKLINGGMAVDQRNSGASQTFTAGAALAYSVDRWYGYCTGANVTGQRVTGATANQYRYQFTGATSVAAIGFGQRIEALNSADLAGTTAYLGVDISNSLLTSVTWTAYYGSATDTFGTLASPSRTQIATGTFTVTSTVSRYTAAISIPSAATTGIEIVFSVGAQVSGTWVIGNVYLGANPAAAFERRPISSELSLCQRYYQNLPSSQAFRWYADVSNRGIPIWFALPVTMRIAPTTTTAYSSGTNVGSPTVTTTTNMLFAYIESAAGGGCQVTLTIGTFSAEMTT
jgi:hypothetical protein